MPPSVQWSWVGGSGPKVRWCSRGVRAGRRGRARLDPGQPPLGVDLEDAVEVLREVDHDGDVAALAGEAGAAAARRSGAPCRGRLPPSRHVLHASRDDDADRDLAVVRGVGGVERAAAVVEADLAVDRGRKLAAAPRARSRRADRRSGAPAPASTFRARSGSRAPVRGAEVRPLRPRIRSRSLAPVRGRPALDRPCYTSGAPLDRSLANDALGQNDAVRQPRESLPVSGASVDQRQPMLNAGLELAPRPKGRPPGEQAAALRGKGLEHVEAPGREHAGGDGRAGARRHRRIAGNPRVRPPSAGVRGLEPAPHRPRSSIWRPKSKRLRADTRRPQRSRTHASACLSSE